MTGAVIALTVKQPALAIPLAFLSHFVQDTFPHWNYGVSRSKGKPQFFNRQFYELLITDFLLSVTLMVVLAFLFPAHKWLIWTCMVAAASPDLVWAYYRLYREHIKKQKPHYDLFSDLHRKIQWSQAPAGALVEIAWFLAAGVIILSLR